VISPADLVALTFIPASIISLIMIPLLFRRTVTGVLRHHWWLFLGLALISILGFQYIINYVETVLPSGVTSLIVNTWPILTVILGSVFLDEKMTTSKVTGTLIAFVGIVVLVMFGAEREASSHDITASEWVHYSLITLLCPVSAAVITTISRWYLTRDSENGENADPVLYALLLRLPTGFIVLTFWRPPEFFESIPAIPSVSLFLVLVLLVIASRVFGFWLWNWALQRIEAGNTAIFSYIQALFALVIARIWLNELIGPAISWATAAIILGVLIANWEKWREPVKPGDLPMKQD
jgi:drug/metabolite transporter (DMT)-like permease